MNSEPIQNTKLDDAYKTIKSYNAWKNPSGNKSYSHVLPHANYSPWLDDATFIKLYNVIKDHALVDIYRCYELWTLAKQLQDVEGDIVEVGVWRGGTGAILAKAVENQLDKKVYLCDTYQGVVKSSELDGFYENGVHADTSVETVVSLMRSIDANNTQIVQGIFPDDNPEAIPGKIALIHIDVDVYLSAKDIVQWAFPRVANGGMLVFDDYGARNCDGIAELCNELSVQLRNYRFIHNINGHAIFVKISDCI